MPRLVVLVVVLAAAALWPAHASAVSVFASRDAQRAVVLHHEPLVASDTDDEQDFYLYEDGALELLSVGPTGGNGDFEAGFATNSTPDLDTVFFRTAEKLVATDTDGLVDIYRRDVETQTTTLMTPGTAAPMQFGTVSDDGSKLVFVTGESLAGDADGGDDDVFLSNGSSLTLLSPQRPGEPSRDVLAYNLYTNNDASRVFFSTNEELTADDTDGLYEDVYEWSNGSLKRISTGATDPNGASLVSIVSPLYGRLGEGDSIFFTSNEKLTGDDGDGTTDVFERDGTTTTRWETGGGSPHVDAEGTRMIFNSSAQLGDGDADAARDVYLATGPSTYTRVSKGGGGNGSFDAHHWGTSSSTRDFDVHTFTTAEPLASPDADDDEDVFRWEAGALTLASGPPTAQADTIVAPERISDDGSHVYFVTNEQLTPADTDTAFDVYSRAGSTTTLISTGPGQAGPPDQAYSVQPAPDGSRVFFMTEERLLAEDTDDEEDAYLRIGPDLRLVSRRATPPPPREVADPVIASRFGSASYDVNGRPVHVFRAGEVGACLSLDVETVIASGAGTLSNVRLLLDPKGDPPPQPFTMEDRGNGLWRVLGVGCFPRGTSDLVVCYDLTEGDRKESFCITIGGVVLIDPQGVVYDKQAFDLALAAGRTEEQARNESAIPGAVVTLQRGSGGVFGDVLSGDPGIAPNVNPQTTGADGLFRWDVAAGTYRVVVVRDGYESVTSREVIIPPPVLDLHIAMDRIGAAGPPGGPPVVPNPRDETPPSVAACGARTLRVDRRRRLKVCLTSSEAVTGTVAVAARKPRRGTPKRRRFTARLKAKRFVAPAGRRVSVSFRLSSRQAATLRRARRATVVLTVVATDAAGNRARTTLPRTLTPPRRRR